MKKKIMFGLSVLATAMLLTACGGTQQAAETPATETPATETPATESTGAAKTGLGIITTISSSKNAAADAEGLAQVDSLVAAVIVDSEGKLVKIAIDGMQTRVNFDATGKITTDPATVFESKMTLGEAYGMKQNSAIGREWNEQIQAFIDYAEGKTVDELKAIELDAEGRPSGVDLVSSVTIHVNDVIKVIEKAAGNAQELGANADDTLGLAIETTIAKSKDAAADAEGLVQAYTNYVVTTLNAEGKVSSVIIDGSQTNINFDATGVISTDLASEPQTKVELGDSYGMKSNSAIGKEWYEQVKAFAEYVAGKTIDEIKALELDAEGRLTAADIVSSVSIHVNEQIALLEKAAANAR